MARRPAINPSSGGSSSGTPSVYDRQRLQDALLERVRQEGGVGMTSRMLANSSLEAENWNLDRAYTRYMGDRQTASNRARVIPNPMPAGSLSDDEDNAKGKDDEDEEEDEEDDDDDDDDESDDALLKEFKKLNADENSENERRTAALVVREAVREATAGDVILSISEAVLILRRVNFDLDAATNNWEHLRSRLYRYNHMRPPLPVKPVVSKDKDNAKEKEKEKDRMAQDERLAELSAITGRPDWQSLRQALQEVKWDLVAAVINWFIKGIVPIKAKGANSTRIDVNGRSIAVPSKEDCKPPNDMDTDWSDDPDVFPDPPIDDTDSDSDESGMIKADRNRRPAFLINDRRARRPVRKGERNKGKFLIESIRDGKYKGSRYWGDSRFYWPEKGQKQTGNKVLFDFDKQEHVDLLNNWRRQTNSRLTGLNTRKGSQKWSKEENDELYKLSKNLLEERMKADPTKTRDDLLPLRVSTKTKEEWTEHLNTLFKYDANGNERDDRKFTAIMTQRGRLRKMVDDFQVKPDEAWFKKQEERKAKNDAKDKDGKTQDDKAKDGKDKDAEDQDVEDQDVEDQDVEDQDVGDQDVEDQDAEEQNADGTAVDGQNKRKRSNHAGSDADDEGGKKKRARVGDKDKTSSDGQNKRKRSAADDADDEEDEDDRSNKKKRARLDKKKGSAAPEPEADVTDSEEEPMDISDGEE